MPQVPYNPVPNVDPSGAIPRVGVNTPEAAFGGGVARAVEGLGGTMEGVGNELFSRALELKRLQTETEVNDASTRYITEGGEQLERFQSLKGNNASPKALQGFVDDHNTFRNTIRVGLSSDYARRIFDRETLSTNRYLTVHAAGHAATETKSSLIGSAQAREAAEERTIGQTPLDNNNWNTVLERLEPSARLLGNAMGWDEDQIQNYMGNRRSALIAIRAEGLGRTDPGKAKEFIEANKFNMNEKDYNKVNYITNGHYRDVGARTTSGNVNAYPEGPGLPAWMSKNEAQILQSVQEPLSRVIRQMSIDNPDLKFNITSGYRSVQHNKDVGGAPESQHLTGGALDWVAKGDPGVAAQAFEDTAAKLGVPVRTIVEKDHIHVMIPKGTDLSKVPLPVAESEASRSGRAVRQTDEDNPDDPWQRDATLTRSTGEYKMIQSMITDQARRDRYAVGDYIAQNRVKDPSILSQDEKIRDVWDRLRPEQQTAFVRRILRLDDRPSDPRVLNDVYTLWKGDGKDPDHVNKFLNLDLDTMEGLSNRDRESFKKKQIDIQSNPSEVDSRFHHALGLFRYEKGFEDFYGDKNSDEWKSFARSLGTILDQYYVEHKKSMPDSEVLKVGNNLILGTMRGFWGNVAHPIDYLTGNLGPGEHPAITKTTPAAAEINRLQMEAEAEGKKLSDEDALRLWRSTEYNRLFGKPGR